MEEKRAEFVLDGVREYAEGYPVRIVHTRGLYAYGVPDESRSGYGRLVVQALNEGGHNVTHVDLLDLLAWVKKNMPDVYGLQGDQ